MKHLSRILFVMLLLAGFFMSGCLRLEGNAGFWKQGPRDEGPKIGQIGFDTDQWV